ncbi:helix-turn-helix domain-containing protein [Kitasatospora sp. NPDC054939]
MPLEQPSSQRPGTEIEVSSQPDVARLASELTTLFRALGVTQEQYAVRINLDSSLVSRYLRGRRVAPSDFINRLLKEVEVNRGSRVTQEVRDQLRQLRMRALQAVDPRQYELESLQESVERSRRNIHRLELQCEGLVLLLDQKEAEASQSKRDLLQLQSDWIAERVADEASRLLEKGDRSRLEDEVESLRTQLAEAIQLKDLAEQRCRDLMSEMVNLEKKIAAEIEEGNRQDRFDLKADLAAHWRAGDNLKAYQVLVNSALTAPIGELIEISAWLLANSRAREAKQLLVDAVRLRPLNELILVCQAINQSGPLGASFDMRSTIYSEISSSRTYDEVLTIHAAASFDDSGSKGFVLEQVDATAIMTDWVNAHSPVEAVTALKDFTEKGHHDTTRTIARRIARQRRLLFPALDILSSNSANLAELILTERFTPRINGQFEVTPMAFAAILSSGIPFQCWDFIASWQIAHLRGNLLHQMIHSINLPNRHPLLAKRFNEKLTLDCPARLNEKLSARTVYTSLRPITALDNSETLGSALIRISNAQTE